MANMNALDDIIKPPTFLNQFIWFKNGDSAPHIVDYLTSIGIVALAENHDAIFVDYKN